MARVHRTHHGVRSSETPRIDRSRAVRKKKPYKILLEAVTKEKKKLHSVLSYTADAPRGYSFVPAGNPDLTEYCKEVCRRRGLNVYIVSAKPKNKAHANPDKISHHVHRLGHHFPNKVIDEACDVLGYLFRGGTYEKSTRMLDSSRLARSLAVHGNRMRLHDRPVTDTETKEQIRAAIRDLFPKIPEDDLTSIVKHAFREGTNRVGNASELPLARRVQLAVVAHIRHCYTDYDHLLKTGTWQEARAKVEQTSLAQLMKWRDEEDNDELEETFREVIILDDDDDDEEDSEDTLSGGESREPSLEIVSSQAAAHELQPNDLAEVEWIDPHNMNRAPGKAYFLRPIRRVVSSARSGPSHVYSAPKAASRPIVDDRARGGHTSSAFSHAHPRPLPLIHPAEARLNYRHEPHEGPRLMEP
ncbi:hypothetical protein K469DRAFT_566988 [Zopfia rhizophila CBS 207.26]|uniref:DUF2293 domain-containing protein n=1 Tax=Zopfia rhizophila CBS 207.26 TaxID=1314779 RepID=A0A6A6ECA4_9PEZI|nr:hypothetical protein K469DRAFT_566988 [Zopfia rhizophila CBS 207.26]